MRDVFQGGGFDDCDQWQRVGSSSAGDRTIVELPPDGPDAQRVTDQHEDESRRQHGLLRRNAEWFCRLRWIVACVLMIAGLAAYFPAWTDWFEVRLLSSWLLVSAAVLIVANGLYLAVLKRLPPNACCGSLRIHLWCQIAVDLVVLTAVVHSLGSYVSYVPVAYLFHIVLACIFFARWESLGVTLISAMLFA